MFDCRDRDHALHSADVTRRVYDLSCGYARERDRARENGCGYGDGCVLNLRADEDACERGCAHDYGDARGSGCGYQNACGHGRGPSLESPLGVSDQENTGIADYDIELGRLAT